MVVIERYLQCPYCPEWKGGHQQRIPKTVGAYRVKIIADNVLIFKCRRCSRLFRYVITDKIFLWEFMKKKQQEEFKSTHYKSKKEEEVKDDKGIQNRRRKS